MSDVLCQTCARPSGDVWLCRSCVDELERDLGDVAWLWEQLQLTITRQARGAPRVGARSSEEPLPFHPTASEAAWCLTNVLTTWARDIAATRGAQIEADDVVGVSRWLMRHRHSLAAHEAVGEMHDEIGDAIRSCWRVIDRPAERIFLGQCHGMDNGVICTEDLYAQSGQAWAHCRLCGHEVDVTQRRTEMGNQLWDRLATAAEIELLATRFFGSPLNVKTIRTWADRGQITSYEGYTAPLHKVSEVMRHAAQSGLHGQRKSA